MCSLVLKIIMIHLCCILFLVNWFCSCCWTFSVCCKSNVTTRLLLQPLRWWCVDCVIHHERDVGEEQHHTYKWREQAIIEWSWHVNSNVACCHSAKLCAYAARDFRSQHYYQNTKPTTTDKEYCIIKGQMLFSRCALEVAVHGYIYVVIKLHYCAWTFSLLKCTVACFCFSLFFYLLFIRASD